MTRANSKSPFTIFRDQG
ncbi:hypothetical protein YPPY19_3528, partial [Yersinia pestis PY-19]